MSLHAAVGCRSSILRRTSTNKISTSLLPAARYRSSLLHRWLSTAASNQGLDSSKLQIECVNPSDAKPKPKVSDLVFGKIFTDHMLTVDWDASNGWDAPRIQPVQDFAIHPGSNVLHYATGLFEGIKAYRGVDGKIRLFRPTLNMARMNITAERCCLPTFDGMELLKCIRALVQLEAEWVPFDHSSSLYIRPAMIGMEASLGVSVVNEARLFVILCPVGPYYSTGFNPVNLFVDPTYVRAWPGGCGYTKMSSNYAPTLWAQKLAAAKGCQQCVWLFGEDHEITEVGSMNIFILLKNEEGETELVTPPLTNRGIILPGVTRRSIIELCSTWDNLKVRERKVTMKEVMDALEEGRLIEMFGSGTAAVVSPVGALYYDGQMQKVPTPLDGVAVQLLEALNDIYYGRVPHPWVVDIDDWNLDARQDLGDYRHPHNVQSP